MPGSRRRNWLSRLTPKPVYAHESLPGSKPVGRSRRWLMTAALFAFIGLLYGGLLIGPTILPFRNLQRVSFRCDAPGARGLCDQPGTAADFFVQVCGRDDVTLTIDQSRFRKGAVADDLTESDYTIYCHDRDLRVENVVTLEVRGDSYLKQDGRSNALQRAWLSGELTIVEVQERLLSDR